MASFLSGCACRGVRPKKVEFSEMQNRERLISKLMEQRNVLRMICAPNGFGKSVLSAQYADLVFSFKKVFWIDCQSPCFTRDLDSGNLVSEIIQICDKPNLVVFDDVEINDEDRSVSFSKVIDELLEYDCEVICNSRPFNNGFMQYQPDASILNSKDLLVDDKEKSFDQGSVINRIPIVVWGSSNSALDLIKCALTEDFSNSVVFSLFYIYLFRTGSLSDLSEYISKSDIKLLNELNKDYLYFGIDENKNSFSVPSIKTSKYFSLFSSKIQTLINVMSCTDRSDLAEKLCSLLVKDKSPEIAMDVAHAIGNKSLRLNLLEKFNLDSIKNLYLLSASRLYNKINFCKKGCGLFTAFQAIRLAVLKKNEKAIRFAYTVLDDDKNSIDNKLLACLVFMRFGNDTEKNQALKIIRHINTEYKIDAYLNSAKMSKTEREKCELINKLISTYFAIYSESRNPFEVWLNELEDDLTDNDIIAASCLFDSYSIIDKSYFRSESYYKFIRVLSGHFNLEAEIDFNLYTYALLYSYYKAIDFIEAISSAPLWDINDKLFAKYDAYKTRLKSEVRLSGFLNSNIGMQKNFSLSELNIEKNNNFLVNNNGEKIPRLRINVLGGLSAFIGDKEVVDSRFGRQNIKLICCILALEKGNEVSKDLISTIIWPDSSEDCRRININSNWSVLRNLFTLPSGDCPYLIRNQNSYKLSSEYIDSDIFDLEHICADLTLGPLDSRSWWESIEKNENLVSGTLLPSEIQNAYIRQKRLEYKNKIVDALVAATERLVEAGEIQQALWFGHKALSRDDTREDVYVALMKAQIQAGQRTPAIETYFACKKFLDEELGIEPSQTISKLYTGVITETPV